MIDLKSETLEAAIIKDRLKKALKDMPPTWLEVCWIPFTYVACFIIMYCLSTE